MLFVFGSVFDSASACKYDLNVCQALLASVEFNSFRLFAWAKLITSTRIRFYPSNSPLTLMRANDLWYSGNSGTVWTCLFRPLQIQCCCLFPLLNKPGTVTKIMPLPKNCTKQIAPARGYDLSQYQGNCSEQSSRWPIARRPASTPDRFGTQNRSDDNVWDQGVSMNA